MQETQGTWARQTHWSGKWQPTPELLPGKFHGQRGLAGHSPRGHKESDTAEHTSTLHKDRTGPLQAAQPGQKGSPNCPSGPHLCMSWLPFPLPLQMTSPLARGLFHRAISQSGTAVFQIFITPDPLKVAKVSVSSLLRFSKGGRMGTHSSTSSLHRRLPSWQAAITTAQRFW